MNEQSATLLIEHLLKKNNSIKDITHELNIFSLIISLEDGDDRHGTYSIYPKSKSYFLHITKCTCGYVHLLEDMCNKCHPDWLPIAKSDPSNINSCTYEDGLPF